MLKKNIGKLIINHYHCDCLLRKDLINLIIRKLSLREKLFYNVFKDNQNSKFTTMYFVDKFDRTTQDINNVLTDLCDYGLIQRSEHRNECGKYYIYKIGD